MSKTSVTVFHINEKYSIGFHHCPNSPELYYLQSAGSIYECFVRRNKITSKNAVLDILVQKILPELAHVVPNGDYIEKWTKTNLSLDDFINAKIDFIEIVHEDYNIKHYLPNPQIAMSKNEIQVYYENYRSLSAKNAISKIHNVKCLIWKVLKDEERIERNKKFEE